MKDADVKPLHTRLARWHELDEYDARLSASLDKLLGCGNRLLESIVINCANGQSVRLDGFGFTDGDIGGALLPLFVAAKHKIKKEKTAL